MIGTPFYIMEFLDGRIIEDASLPDVRPEERREMLASLQLRMQTQNTEADVMIDDAGGTMQFALLRNSTASTLYPSTSRTLANPQASITDKSRPSGPFRRPKHKPWISSQNSP